ncbi:MAG: Lrp/AsnC family transcriptional regulator [Puniceicoccaceae bacterium]
MSEVLKLILEGERLSTAEMAKVLDLTDGEVQMEIERLRETGVILGWRPVLNPENQGYENVRAVIEIRISPEREGGFDRVALRVAGFPEVESCFLMSGAYDLLVFVNGKNLQRVARFVSEKLATLGGVLSTATHFVLRPYKEQGFEIQHFGNEDRKPAVSP